MDDVFTAETKLAPYWWDAAPRPTGPLEDPPTRAQVAVVGSGYTGLSAALALASRGIDVVVLEAESPGWGASSRNGGMVGPAFHLAGAGALSQRFGEERARAILEEGLMMVRHLEDLIAREGIACHYRRSGRFTGATSAKAYDRMARTLEENRRLVDFAGTMIPRARQREEIGSDCFHGGLLLPDDGGLHPGLYHLGLLEATRRAGARVVARSRVEKITRTLGSIELLTPRGTVTAERVIIATNAYTGDATPDLKRRLVPIVSAIIATEELNPALMARLVPNGRMLADTRRVGVYFRPSPDGKRLIFGGRALRQDGSRAAAESNAHHLHARMREIFPDLARTRVSHYWDGKVAFTFDRLPHLGEVGGLHYALGYCGSGVTRSTWFGTKVALKLLGDPEGRSAFDGIEFETRPTYKGDPWFLPALILWYRALDRLGV
jgi:glycine/D-amino acid oxidase-like deaminating enzyme